MPHDPRKVSASTIVHAVTPGRVGGLESVVQLLAVEQHKAGLRVAVVSVVERDQPDHPFHCSLRDAGVDLLVLELPGRSYRREVEALGRAFHHLEAGLVHAHGYRSDVLAGGSARRLGLATVSTAHGFTGGGWKNRLYEFLQVRSWRRFSAVVAVARPLAERILRSGVSPARLHVIPNAWAPDEPPLNRAEARRRLGLDDAAPVIGWVGRLSREKGADVLLEAMAAVPDARAVFLGEGRERSALLARVEALGLTGRVHFPGEIAGAHRLYPAFDLFALSSRTEGMPICLFEAMAASVPVVATRVGGVPDVVGPDEAVLLEPESPEALADGIRRVLADPLAAAGRAGAARARLVREFSPEQWVARYLELYSTILSSSSEPTAR